VASGDNVFGFGMSVWQTPYSTQVNYGALPGKVPGNTPYSPVPSTNVLYLYTDQPVYRPGHPVYFRGVARLEHDVTFSVPANEPVQVTITDPEGKQVYKQTLTLNQFGGLNGSYTPPADAKLGNYSLNVQFRQQLFPLMFQVAEFRPPEFKVDVKTTADKAAAGDTIHVTAAGSFFSGGPVSGAKVTWTAVANQGYFRYLGIDDSFDFYPWRPYGYGSYVYNREVAHGDGKLDDQGNLTFDVPADLGGTSVTQDFTIEATVMDVNNQAISGRTNVTVYPSTVFIGLQPAAYVGKAGKPMDVKILLVDWDQNPIANGKIALKAQEVRWEQDPSTFEWTQKTYPVSEGQVTTDKDGKTTFSFTPPRAGVYEVVADTRDSHERVSETTTSVYVEGSDYINWDRDNTAVTMVADRKHYKPGDTAQILIASPFPEPVQALVTLERAGIMKTDIVTITGSATYSVPLDMTDSPNVYVNVVIVHGSGDKSTPDLRTGTVNLDVFVNQQLKIKITPSADKAKPGDVVKFDVLTTDLNGKPVAAEVGLSLADLANLSVSDSNSGSIFDYFWHQRSLDVSTGTPASLIIDDITVETAKKIMESNAKDKSSTLADNLSPRQAAPSTGALAPTATYAATTAAPAADGAVAQNSAATPPAPRTNFVDTPLWKPDLATDDTGQGTISVTLPDNLTTWRLDVRAISKDTYVGSTTTDVISTKPLLVRPSTPRFFVVGDETELAVVVNNNTDSDLQTVVAIDAKGVTLKADAKQTVTIPKQSRIRVTWAATVDKVSNVDLAFSAVSGDFSDASKPEVGIGDQRLLPVYDYTAPDYVSTAGVLTQPGTRTEAVLLPDATLAPTGDVTIKVQPSLAATTLDGLTYLDNYPYQCIEQTISKFLPNVITLRALQKLHLDRPEFHATLESLVKYAVNRLKSEQHGDGGWGWYFNEESNQLITAYAVLGLTEAKASDLPIDADMLNRAKIYLQSTLRGVDDNTPVYMLNRETFVLYVLAKAGNPNLSLMDSIFGRREKMNTYARAFLAQAYYYTKGDPNKMNTLVSDLQSAAILSATGTHWEEKNRDWWNWDSDTRTTAIVLQTLVMLSPNSPLIPNVVRWLMVARQGDAWESTQETAWAVMALTNYMDATGELKADYSYTVSANDTSVGDGKANADTLRDTNTMKIDIANLLRGQINKIAFDHGAGDGSLYYTATLHVQQPVDQIQPTDRGFSFTRTYYLNGKAVNSAQVGDVITVAVDITLNSDMYYANIEDPIPAGTELLDTSLKTTQQIHTQDGTAISNTPDLSQIDYGWGWGWWWFTHTEMRTEKIVLSASYLPRGTYRYVYQVRATTPGAYKVIPTQGMEFYFPEVFGRGAGTLFTVKP
jgi:uncharacterized protein YfaS (alpha-2-macroglobulin family)